MRLALLSIFFAVTLFAHDIWIEKSDQGYKLLYGHLHISKEHSGAKIIKYDPNKIKKVICKKGDKSENLNVIKEYPLSLKKECDELYIFMDNGYYTKTSYGVKNLPKDSVKMALKSWRSFESIKYLEKNSKKPLSSAFEIVLLNNPKEVGDKARLLILFDKKPIEGAIVAYDSKPRGKSSKDGRVNIRIKREGLQNISATLRKSGDGKKSDEIVYTTTLNFKVEK
ncbi:DUF4198 domain-containing protein [Nitrosophilus labii]|uniref:DUF4198 domain-containing protein n=1 Tax=Nitrosophilus labii TaxID=2706014 RepID=UPI0016573B65|nr:DUF4198 domain-containing protein [Nitrosophilus labii]